MADRIAVSSYVIPPYSVVDIDPHVYNIGHALLMKQGPSFDYELILMDEKKTIGSIKVHRLILEVASGYFSMVLNSKMAESNTAKCHISVPGLTIEEQCACLPRTIETFYNLQPQKPSTLQELACHLQMLNYFEFRGIVSYIRTLELVKSPSGHKMPQWAVSMVTNQLATAKTTEDAIVSVATSLQSTLNVLDNIIAMIKTPSPIITEFQKTLVAFVTSIIVLVWITGIECIPNPTFRSMLEDGSRHVFCHNAMSIWCLDYEPSIVHLINCLVNDTSGILRYTLEKHIKHEWGDWSEPSHTHKSKPICNAMWNLVSEMCISEYANLQSALDNSEGTSGKINHRAVANSKLSLLKSENTSGAAQLYSNGRLYTRMMETLQINMGGLENTAL